MEFEKGQATEAELFEMFFQDGRPVDGEALKSMLVRSTLPALQVQVDIGPESRMPTACAQAVHSNSDRMASLTLLAAYSHIACPLTAPPCTPCALTSTHTLQVQRYEYLPGMQLLLSELKAAGYELHACSNYPAWWQLIEEKLEVSSYLAWTFISCEGPMQVRRCRAN
jgi:hypothetical protein